MNEFKVNAATPSMDSGWAAVATAAAALRALWRRVGGEWRRLSLIDTRWEADKLHSGT